ncbi:MAG: HypC/HybG/HupF family hydrogenase formation chaperone [Azonexus sp.]
MHSRLSRQGQIGRLPDELSGAHLMCLSIPMQVKEWQGDGEFAWVERPGRRECVNMMLVGAQPVGTWLLTSMGLARDVLESEQLAQIEDALAALAASLDGTYDPGQHFHDLPQI